MKAKSSSDLKKPLIHEEQSKQNIKTQKEVASKLKPVSFFSLFRFTTGNEKIQLLIGSLFSIASGAAFPFFLLFFADITMIFDENDRDSTARKGWELCLKFFIVGGATWITHFIGTYLWNIAGSSQAIRIKKLYYKTLLDQEIAWFDQNDPNELVTRVATNITAIEGATGEKISLMLITISTCVAAIFMAFFKCWQLSLIMLAAFPAILAAGLLFMRTLLLHSMKQKVSYEKASSRTEQTLAQIRTVKGLVGEQYQIQKFESALNEGQVTTVKYSILMSTGTGVMIVIFISMYALGLWYGKKLIIDNIGSDQINVATILSSFFCFVIGGSSVGQLTPFFKNIAQGRVSMAEFFDLMNREKTLVELENARQFQKIERIQLKNVSFHYKSDQPVLKNINISFAEGQVSALVGESGCGKSTIVQLLMRYYDCIEGQLTVNGQNITAVNMNNFRRKIGFVGQEPVLFAMTIAENLRLADPTLTEQQMVAALKKANAWEFVQKTEKKLDTYVGSGGTQLSGGQKQRIAIARAICKRPQLLILDQATSALDRKNEREIQQTLKSLQQNKITTVVIAHRLSTVKDADCIYVLKKGEVAEFGSHQRLIQSGGAYSELVKTQMAAQQHLQDQQVQQYTKQVKVENKFRQSIVNHKQTVVAQQIPKEKQDAVFGKLLAYQKSNCGYLMLGVLAATVAGLVWPFFSYLFSGLIDFMIDAASNDQKINQYCLYIVFVALTAGFTTFLYTLAFNIASQRLVYRLRVNLFKKLMRLPLSFYDQPQNTAGGINSKLATDAYQIRNMVSGVMGVMCLNLATVGAALTIGLIYSWKVTLITLALSPFIAVVGAINMKVIMKFSTKSEQAQKFLGSLMSDSVCNMRTVKSFGDSGPFLNKFDSKLDQISEVNSQKFITSCFLGGMSKAMIMIVEGVIFYLAAVLFQAGQVQHSRDVFTAVMSIIFAAVGIGQNSTFMPDMAKAKLAGAGIFDIIESKGEDQLNKQQGGNITEDLEGSVQFKNVTFQYPQREKLVLENLSFKIERGKFALVGHSGSGKSTIVQLLLRFYDPTSGEILLNGRNIKEFDLYALRRQYGLVSQQPALFIGSVEDNIRYNSGCSKEEMQAATEVAHAKKFIAEWDEGFEKEVGQKGGQVSGGQKQRIALSRCLVKKPRLFLFDEFTSALDADTEKIVFENLKAVLKEKTSISVAHRLSTIEDANRILVFKDGKIIEEGTFNELMQLQNHFYSLAKGQ